MRLLDLIAQEAHVLWVHGPGGSVQRLAGAGDHAQRLRACPLRYVLSDELARLCAAIGYSDGRRLTDCIDLLRVPARRVWIEWSDEVREREYLRAGGMSNEPGAPPALRAGLLIDADASGRRGSFHTFWSTREHAATARVAALETHFDFDDPEPAPGSLQALLLGAPVALLHDDTLAPIMRCVRYRFCPSWAQYYSHAALEPRQLSQVVRASLATVAHDLPMLLALLLLLAANAGVSPVGVDLARINRKRSTLGKRPLLEHVVMSLSLPFERRAAAMSRDHPMRRSPRWHHVRGHLVRRANAVYWRAPHWRGHLRLGEVKTRTVELRAPATPPTSGGDARY
jgi:hypothetical protein